MAERKNYNSQMEQIMLQVERSGQKAKLLLHVCCAPCSSAVLERLANVFDITLFFDNPNLDSKAEHDLRSREVERLVLESGLVSRVIISPYDPESFQKVVNGLTGEPEGGARCLACFRLRLSNSALKAKDLSSDWFTTTLTISPRKDAAVLNELGQGIGEGVGVPFLPSDFKKRGGFQRSIALSREFGLYRQDYCGCVYSKRSKA
ncbi:MAG: epoxyqueuosine reductase QueH [Clostridiales bacterium]|nr:epoxyqueuosine reductase QueH [Clostridiales bacterium]